MACGLFSVFAGKRRDSAGPVMSYLNDTLAQLVDEVLVRPI
jgi:hypothetical protein